MSFAPAERQNRSCPVRNSFVFQTMTVMAPDDELMIPLPHSRMHLSLVDISQNLHLPLPQAAKQMSMSPALLKRFCRHYGIKRWPYRKAHSVSRQLLLLQHSSRTTFSAKLAEGIASLRKLRTTVFAKLQYTTLDPLIFQYIPLPLVPTIQLAQNSPSDDSSSPASAIVPTSPFEASSTTTPQTASIVPQDEEVSLQPLIDVHEDATVPAASTPESTLDSALQFLLESLPADSSEALMSFTSLAPLEPATDLPLVNFEEMGSLLY